MNAFEYSDLLPPLSLGVANLFFASLLHRAIVHNSTLLRRRHFFESLAVLAFLVALILLVSGFALWRENPLFVLVCSGGWMIFCTVAAAVLGRRNRHRADDELALPDLWPSVPEPLMDADRDGAGHRGARASGPSGATHDRAVPLDAFTRARLKKTRRERSAGNERLRTKHPVRTDENSPKRDLPKREGR